MTSTVGPKADRTVIWGRLPFLGLAIVLLLSGLWAGLIRLGWPWPVFLVSLPMAHGPVMVNGFLATLIGLERAVALQARWAYAAPLLTAAGALLLATGIGGTAGLLLILLGGLLLLAVMGRIFLIHPTLDIAIIGIGVVLGLVGNLLWLLGWPIPHVIWWWAGFVIFTIAGERLELSRYLHLSRRAILALFLALFLFIGGLVLSLVRFAFGVQIAGCGMIAVAGWLLYYDIARRRVKAGGQARFTALCLLSGYVWLGVGGVLSLFYPGYLAGPVYDAMVHAIFLGFVFTMIFGHAPIVFPAVLQRPFAYSPRFYTHLLLLHITLLLRIGGDLLLWWPGRLWGGLLNALVLLLFLLNTVAALRRTSKGLKLSRTWSGDQVEAS